MELYHSSQAYLFNLATTSSAEAKRIWRRKVREQWDNECAYCGSEENITLDHVVPRSKGGVDYTHNVVACCESCNRDKSHTPWMEWYQNQVFFTEARKNAIINWMDTNNPVEKPQRFRYRQRRNNAS